MNFKFNTGRMYSTEGQIIHIIADKAKNTILFNDETRGITGLITNRHAIWKDIYDCEYTLRTKFLDWYDAGDYSDISSSEFWVHTKAYEIGKENAKTAIDQRDAYSSWDEAKSSYEINVDDTLIELGMNSTEDTRAARYGFNVTASEWESQQPVKKCSDPDYNEMLEFLKGYAVGVTDCADDFDYGNAIYWFASEWHHGQGSNLYEAIEACGYRPGASENGVCPYGDAFTFHMALEAEYTYLGKA